MPSRRTRAASSNSESDKPIAAPSFSWASISVAFERRKKAANTITMAGSLIREAEEVTLSGDWVFTNRRKGKKGNPFKYTREFPDERDSKYHRHPACIHQNMERTYTDFDTVEKGLYSPEIVSPVFFGSEGGDDYHRKDSAAQSDKERAVDAMVGLWDGRFELPIASSSVPLQIDEHFRLRSRFGPNISGVSTEVDPEDTNSVQVIGRGINEFGKFTVTGKYSLKTEELRLTKVYDPIVKKRSRSFSAGGSGASETPEASRSSKRQRKESNKIRFKRMQEEAIRKAEEDAVIAKRERAEERRLLRIQRAEEEKRLQEERKEERRRREEERKKKEEERKVKEAERMRRELEQRAIDEAKRQEEEKKRAAMEEECRLKAIEEKKQKIKELAEFAAKLEERRKAAALLRARNPPPNIWEGGGTRGGGPVLNSTRLLDVSVGDQNSGAKQVAGISQFSRGKPQLRPEQPKPKPTRGRGRPPMNRDAPVEYESSSSEDEMPDGTPRLLATVYDLGKGRDFRCAHAAINGEIYEGEFKDHLRDGLGTCLYTNGDMYEGEWKEGMVHGQGLITNSKGDMVCRGVFADGRINGKATFHHNDGSLYSGDWRESRRHGLGTYTDAHGNVYNGEWKDNVRQGHGTTRDVNNNVFEGEWFRDLRHGAGTLTCVDGTHYEGSWKNNQLEGRGVITYPDGGRYEGTLRNGVKDGRGMYIFPSKSEYEGRFRNDKIHGMGTLRMGSGITMTSGGKGAATEGVKTEQGDDGSEETEEIMIPIDMQKDLPTVHFIAGFDRFGN
jgi:hypothetical protein